MLALPRTHSEPDDVAHQLAALGLTADPFQAAISRARLEWATCTENDPPSYPGTVFWGTTVRTLREELRAVGWTKADPRNLSVAYSPDGMRAIIVETGDELTGSPDERANPSTKSPKGVSILDAVEANVIQLDLFGVPFVPQPVPASGRILTYVFLIRIEKDGQPAAELSLPNGMSQQGKIAGWKQRIVIPTAAGEDPMPASSRRRGPEPAPDVDVVVTRRAG